MGPRAFIATKVHGPEAVARGETVGRVLAEIGCSVFLPRKREGMDAVEILDSNEREVDEADLVVCVFDEAGAGVAMELGRAHAAGKLIIGYRSDSSLRGEYLGKMLEGFWARLPEGRKTCDLEVLRSLCRSAAESLAPDFAR